MSTNIVCHVPYKEMNSGFYACRQDNLFSDIFSVFHSRSVLGYRAFSILSLIYFCNASDNSFPLVNMRSCNESLSREGWYLPC